MDIDFLLKPYHISKIELKRLGIDSSQDLNGIFSYAKKKSYVNLLSFEYTNIKSVNTLIKKISETIIHETLHYTIFNIRNEYADEGEEIYVNCMLTYKLPKLKVKK